MLTCGEKEIFQEIQELGKLNTENTKLGEIQEQSHFHWNLFTKRVFVIAVVPKV